mmetsp:Transcript_7059/g.11885  ORF Transcript_7059/g.11885 Transcript_7059/m.11885 type:complete len:317 (-) Transcript_7059:482-1432(-)
MLYDPESLLRVPQGGVDDPHGPSLSPARHIKTLQLLIFLLGVHHAAKAVWNSVLLGVERDAVDGEGPEANGFDDDVRGDGDVAQALVPHLHLLVHGTGQPVPLEDHSLDPGGLGVDLELLGGEQEAENELLFAIVEHLLVVLFILNGSELLEHELGSSAHGPRVGRVHLLGARIGDRPLHLVPHHVVLYALERSQLSNLLGGEGRVGDALPSNALHVLQPRLFESLDHFVGHVGLLQILGVFEQDPRHVAEDVAVANDGHVFTPGEVELVLHTQVIVERAVVPVDHSPRGHNSQGVELVRQSKQSVSQGSVGEHYC